MPNPSEDFTLDPQLARDTMPVGDLPLCRVLLINDANYRWLLLVPRRRGVSEIIDLDAPARAQLMTEIASVSRVLKELSGCDKLNVAALGNVVEQLHVHIIARSRGDAAWPKPVWGAAPAKAYEKAQIDRMIDALRQALTLKPV